MFWKPSKFYIYDELKNRLTGNPTPVSILELGAGKAHLISELLKDVPNIIYTGIEPDQDALAIAKERLANYPNVQCHNRLAYSGHEPTIESEQYDMVLSLSVLEHIKDLDSFFDFADKHTKPGGCSIHLYDLGHSLYPSSIKERIQVALCNSFLRRFIPENKIAFYLPLSDVTSKLEKRGYSIEKITYHNMPSNVSLLKKSDDMEQLEIMAKQEPIFAEKLPHSLAKEKLFPAICVWARKLNPQPES